MFPHLHRTFNSGILPPEVLMIWLLFALFVKHFLADFPMQTPYMLQKGALTGWAAPLAAHCVVPYAAGG